MGGSGRTGGWEWWVGQVGGGIGRSGFQFHMAGTGLNHRVTTPYHTHSSHNLP